MFVLYRVFHNSDNFMQSCVRESTSTVGSLMTVDFASTRLLTSRSAILFCVLRTNDIRLIENTLPTVGMKTPLTLYQDRGSKQSLRQDIKTLLYYCTIAGKTPSGPATAL